MAPLAPNQPSGEFEASITDPYLTVYERIRQPEGNVMLAAYPAERLSYQNPIHVNHVEMEKYLEPHLGFYDSTHPSSPFSEVGDDISPRAGFSIFSLPSAQPYPPVSALCSTSIPWNSSLTSEPIEEKPRDTTTTRCHLGISLQSLDRERVEPDTRLLGHKKKVSSNDSKSEPARQPPPCRPNLRLPTPELPDLPEAPLCARRNIHSNGYVVEKLDPEMCPVCNGHSKCCRQHSHKVHGPKNCRSYMAKIRFHNWTCSHGHSPEKYCDC